MNQPSALAKMTAERDEALARAFALELALDTLSRPIAQVADQEAKILKLKLMAHRADSELPLSDWFDGYKAALERVRDILDGK